MTDLPVRKLGRVPSPWDERDYKLENFLGLDTHLLTATPEELATLALNELRLTEVTYKRWAATKYADVTVTHWWKAINALNTIVAPTPPPIPSGEVWVNNEPTLDQGDYGTCVGNGYAQWGNTLPVDDKYTETDARAIYYEATILDGWPDDPDAPGGGQMGATVRSGAKVMVNRKRTSAYAFTSSLATIQKFLKEKGPMVVGTDWTEDMFTPDKDFFVVPSGVVAGGHCYALVGDLAAEGGLLFLNSWGKDWGEGGYFKMKYDDFMELVTANGEVCAIVELP